VKLYQADDFFGSSAKFDMRKFLKRLLNKWWYFLIFLPIFLFAGLAYLYFTPAKYHIRAKIITNKQDVNEALSNDENKGSFGIIRSDKNLYNEIEVLQSFSLSKQVAQSLDLNVSYYQVDKFKKQSEFNFAPYRVITNPNSLQVYYTPFYIKFINNQTYEISISEEDFWIYRASENKFQKYTQSYKVTKQCTFGEACEDKFFNLVIEKDESFDISQFGTDQLTRYFTLNTTEDIAKQIQGDLLIEVPNEEATVVSISIHTPDPNRGVLILEELIKQYQIKKLQEKNEFASGTIDFINNQIASVSDSLRGVEDELTNIRQRQSSLNLSEKASRAQKRLVDLQTEREKLQLRRKYYESLTSTLESKSDMGAVVAPSAMGITDPILTELILELKRLYSQKVELSYKAPKSPELDILNQKIELTRETLSENVKGMVNSAEISMEDIDSRIEDAYAELGTLPQGEQDIVNVQRNFDLNNNLFTYLQRKKAEAEISLAANSPDIDIIEEARMVSNTPISPNRQVIIALSILLGLVIPLGIVIIQEYFSGKVEDYIDLQALTKTPIIASIPHGAGDDVLRTGLMDSITLEAFRFLKLKLLRYSKEESFKSISITSYLPEEGKNYCATNLASAIAFSGKRVILIDTDMRKEPIKYKLAVGLSELLRKEYTLDEVIQQTEIENLDYIHSGSMVLKPTELLESDQMPLFMEWLRQHYDFILINTPPVGLVSDYYVLSRYTDLCLFVVRHKHSPIENINQIDEIRKSTDPENTYIVYNDVTKEGKKYKKYGKNYGYVGKYGGKVKLQEQNSNGAAHSQASEQKPYSR